MRLRIAFTALVLIAGLLTAAAKAPDQQVSAAGLGSTAVPAIDRLHSERAEQALADRQAAVVAAAAEQARAEDEARRQAQAAKVAAAAKRPAEPGTSTGASPAPTGSGDAEAAVREFFGDVFDQAWGSANNYGVTMCESGHNPGAVSSGGANWGLFQINSVHHDDFETYTGQPWSEVLNAHYNAMYARKLYDGHGGWARDWSCAWAAYR